MCVVWCIRSPLCVADILIHTYTTIAREEREDKKMGNEVFLKKSKKIIESFIAENYGLCRELMKDGYKIYPVWLCKTLQNNKGLFSTTMSNGLYFEITYDGERCQFYFDVYKKIKNVAIAEEVMQ